MADHSANQEIDIQTYNAGEQIFTKGDMGGDLYIIMEGEVDIYNVDSVGVDIVLNTMKAGEILGLLSILTKDRRLASAKAKTKCVLKRIENEKLTKLIGTLPPWMRTVIKDMTIRLDQMNKQYIDAKKEIQTLKRTQISCFFLASQIAGTASAIGSLIAITVDENKFVVIDTLIEKLETILTIERELIVRLFEVFTDCGVLRIQIEPDQKRKVVSLKAASDIGSFVKFVQDYRGTKLRKLRQSRLIYKDLRVVNGLVKLAVRMKLDVNTEVSMDLKNVEESMPKALGVAFDRNALETAQEVGLLKLTATDVCFVPRELSQIMTNLTAYKRIEKLDAEVWNSKADPAAAA